MTCGKRESVSEQHSINNRRSVGAEPYAPKKMKAITERGREGRHLRSCDHGLCMSRSWKVEVFPKKIKHTKTDYQSAISSKEYVKYEATQTYLSVTYQNDRLHLTGKRPQQRSQGPQQHKSTPSTHRVYFSNQRVFSGKKKHQTMRCRDECMAPLVFSVDTVYLLPPSRGAA